MKANRTQMQNALAVGLIATGLIWGAATEISAHAQQPPAPAAAQVVALEQPSDLPKLENGDLQIRELAGSLSDSVTHWASGTSKAEWLGYAVAEVKGDHSVCCSQSGDERNHANGCGRCRLEGANSGVNISSHGGEEASVKLEGARELAVLYRAESGKIGQIRIVSLDCGLDAGGLRVIWLRGVNASASVNLLLKFVQGADLDSRGPRNISQEALAAIALHADPASNRALESFVAPTQPESLRKESVFWLGEARGAEGLRILQALAQHDSSIEVRKQVTFALSISREPAAVPEMIRIANDDQSPEVRGQALFWLGQKAGDKAAKAIAGAIDNDPDTEVKKKAVFALSQMPREQGVPRLIQVAQTNRNPAVRKEAMFWLGQSGDPQALAFFEKILSQ